MEHTQTKLQTNRQYKDRLFRLIFGSEENKEFILSLYNALNGTDYTDTTLLDITTIQDVIYMGMKNDSAFILDSELNLFEQQSSFNPNMPFREFQYCAKMLNAWVIGNDFDVYGSTLIKIPTPRCYVFYNGLANHEDKKILKLSDAFIKKCEGYEWTVTMLNINSGHNEELLQKCQVLSEYTDFVDTVRTNSKIMKIEMAVDSAVKTFILKKGILSDFLEKHRAEVLDMCITEYNEELHINNEKKISHNEGRIEGREAEILSSVHEGDYSVERGAQKLGITVEEFKERMKAAGYKIPESV